MANLCFGLWVPNSKSPSSYLAVNDKKATSQKGLLHFLLQASGYARLPSTQELMASSENYLPGSEEMNCGLLPGAVCYLQS